MKYHTALLFISGLFLLVLLFLCRSLVAENLSERFPVGKGSSFDLRLEGQKCSVMIYVTPAPAGKLGIEMFFTMPDSTMATEMWQQVWLQPNGDRVSVDHALLFTPGMERPETVDVSSLVQKEGLRLSDFLMTDPKSVEKYKVGVEWVRTPAGRLLCSHYRQERDGQVLDYWISDKALPVGLVMLQSKGKQSYQMVLNALVQNVRAKINPSQAGTLSPKGRELLALPQPKVVLP